MGDKFRDVGHLFRLLYVAIGIVIVFIGARHIFVPASFGAYGHYRGDSLAQIAQKPIKHADPAACKNCHPDVVSQKMHSKHRSVNCQICHGILAEHVANPMELKPIRPKDDSRCLLCHKRNVSRPRNFPQVDPGTHAGGLSCLTCHRPHHPELTASRSSS